MIEEIKSPTTSEPEEVYTVEHDLKTGEKRKFVKPKLKRMGAEFLYNCNVTLAKGVEQIAVTKKINFGGYAKETESQKKKFIDEWGLVIDRYPQIAEFLNPLFMVAARNAKNIVSSFGNGEDQPQVKKNVIEKYLGNSHPDDVVIAKSSKPVEKTTKEPTLLNFKHLGRVPSRKH